MSILWSMSKNWVPPRADACKNVLEMSTLELRPLQDNDEASFRAAVEEFERELPPWGFAFEFKGEKDFPSYVAKVNNWSRGIGVPKKFVPNSYYVGVVKGRIVGRVSIRHELNEFLRNYGGHIGYGVVPSQRGKGYATEMLRLALLICIELGIERALVSCDVDNIASQKVIERNGGIFDCVTNLAELTVQKRLYWIHAMERGFERYRGFSEADEKWWGFGK